MAIFYNYIKGCGSDAQVNSDLLDSENSTGILGTTSSDIWTFLKWSDQLTYKKTETSIDTHYANNNPIIYLNSCPTYEGKEWASTGRILTSQARNQEMWYDLHFKNGPTEGDWIEDENSTTDETVFEQTTTSFDTYTSNWSIKDTTNDDNVMLQLFGKNTGGNIQANYQLNVRNGLVAGTNTTDTNFFLPSYENRFGSPASLDGQLIIKDAKGQRSNNRLLEVWGPAQIGGSKSGEYVAHFPHQNDNNAVILFSKSLKIDSAHYCQAGYFNATSDMRAKENIRKSNFSALSIINSLPIYNFNYKNSDKPSIGVIAQEAARFDIDDFSLVENIEASGKDNDFMSIKESKLIYILWKAIQEQQEEIEDLKKQLRGDK